VRPHIIILFAILVLASLLRLVNLGHTPAGFTPDEASQGYTAYSLLKTGQDEWGISWPITSFRAFNDYRAPLQTYLIIPFIAVFGLNEFSVRLPSALFGTLAVLFVYFLAKYLFPTDINTKRERYGYLPIFAALFLAISPWHIQFSRMALEANYSSFFFTGGLFFFLLGQKRPRFLIFSGLLFGLNLYSYLAAKIFVPLFVLGILIIYRDTLFNSRKYLIFFLLILTFFGAPLYLDTFFGPGNIRGQDVIITNFSKENIDEISNIQYLSPLNNLTHYGPWITRIFENKFVFAENKFVENYLSYLSPAFWFAESGREISYAIIPGRGLLYLWMFPFLLYGFYSLVTNIISKTNVSQKRMMSLRRGKPTWLSQASKVIFIWLLFGILPAAITKEGYRPNRAGSLLSIFEIISAYGLVNIIRTYSFTQKVWVKVGFGLVICVSLIYYLVDLFAFWPIKFPESMSYGYRDLVSKVMQYDEESVIIDKGSESHIFFAFYSHMPPRDFQAYSNEWWKEIQEKDLQFVDMQEKYKLDRYTFKTFDASTDIRPNVIVVIPAKKMTEILRPYILNVVYYKNREPAFYLLKHHEK
jgi:4-amino-4-deoxy-L-arabinose transferase-like glycosyltransferase